MTCFKRITLSTKLHVRMERNKKRDQTGSPRDKSDERCQGSYPRSSVEIVKCAGGTNGSSWWPRIRAQGK